MNEDGWLQSGGDVLPVKHRYMTTMCTVYARTSSYFYLEAEAPRCQLHDPRFIAS